jgi:pre-mRNA-splicing helicase BRR2
MWNDKCQLPDGSFRKQRKGNEEVHVPALKPKALTVDEALVGIDELLNYTQPHFDGFKSLNRVKSRIHKVAFVPDQN